jgi:protein TonB
MFVESTVNDVSLKTITMDIKQILTADVLDIIFDGRNKDYGAYELRKTYNQRLFTALSCSALFVALLLSGYLLAGNATQQPDSIYVEDVKLDDVSEKKQEEPVVIQPKQKEVVQVKTIQDVIPRIVVDEVVSPEEMPPTQDEKELAKIGFRNIDGVADDGITPPAREDNKGIIDLPKKDEEDIDKIVIDVQIESEYPGGTSSWIRFIKKNLSNYPEEALEKGVQGTVVVRFIVDREGNVSEVEAVSGPEELKAAAVTVIRKSGKWKPAEHNGRKVKSYKKQPITFRLGDE